MTDMARHGPDPAPSDPTRSDSVGAEPSAVPPGDVDIARIVSHLAEQPGRGRTLDGNSDPTWHDVRAALAHAGPNADGGSGEAANPPGPPAFQTPQAFYAELMQRPDIRRILEALDE